MALWHVNVELVDHVGTALYCAHVDDSQGHRSSVSRVDRISACISSLGTTAIGQSRVFITYDINQIRVFFAVNFMCVSI
jgi:hypothetical protein